MELVLPYDLFGLYKDIDKQSCSMALAWVLILDEISCQHNNKWWNWLRSWQPEGGCGGWVIRKKRQVRKTWNWKGFFVIRESYQTLFISKIFGFNESLGWPPRTAPSVLWTQRVWEWLQIYIFQSQNITNNFCRWYFVICLQGLKLGSL